jgi:hypothetical protein
MPRKTQRLAPQQFSPLPQLPGWARRNSLAEPGETTPKTTSEAPYEAAHEAAFRAGAALALLDARVRAEAPFAGVWRQRLALKAAAASARILRRGEDEAMLRDAFYLRHGNDDPGPAGRILAAWRALSCCVTTRSTALDADAVTHVANLLGLNMDAEFLRAAIDSAQRIALDPASYRGAPFAAAEIARLLFRSRPDAEI